MKIVYNNRTQCFSVVSENGYYADKEDSKESKDPKKDNWFKRNKKLLMAAGGAALAGGLMYGGHKYKKHLDASNLLDEDTKRFKVEMNKIGRARDVEKMKYAKDSTNGKIENLLINNKWNLENLTPTKADKKYTRDHNPDRYKDIW